MAVVNGVPASYGLSKTYKYHKEVVYIFTDGEHYIFAAGTLDRGGPDNDKVILWHTISAPCPIGNAP